MRVLREKADDTNVRLSTVTQELEARAAGGVIDAGAATALSPSQEPAAAASESATAPNGAAGAPGAPAPASQARPAHLAAEDVRQRLRRLHRRPLRHRDHGVHGVHQHASRVHDKADDAQLNIGHSLYGAGKYAEAVAAFQKVITNYPQADSVPSRTTSWG